MIAISASELLVMKELWRNPAGLTTPEVIARVRGVCDWDENTVKTLLLRLVKKGAVEASGPKRAYVYRPLVAEDSYREEAADSFVRQLFDSSAAQLMCFFAERGKLSKQEIEQLKELLDKAESK